MKKRLLTLTLALAMGLSLAACSGGGGTAATPAPQTGAPAAGSDWAYVQGNGSLKIGYTVFEPMNYTGDDGEFTGFETEFARAVCGKLGVEPEFVEINWDAKVMELESKHIDCIWNGMTITDERMENMFFAKPYIANQQIIIVPAASGITSVAQLEGKVIGLQKGSSSLEALTANPISEKVKEIVEYPDNVAAYMDLQAGRIDVFVVDSVVGRYIISQDQK